MRSIGIRSGCTAVVITAATLGAVVGGLSGCGDDPGRVRPSTGSRPGAGDPGAEPLPASPAATSGVRVLYDGAWLVEEGQWWLGSAEAYFDRGDIPTFRRILESVNPGSVSITIPAADGRYRTRVELREVSPAVADWCEDVAESSLEVPVGVHVVTMGSFETSEDLPVPRAGWYRVRYCTEEQDRAAAEDAFVREGHTTTYTGRHLIQLWPAPRAGDRVLGEGSQWARRLASGRWQ